VSGSVVRLDDATVERIAAGEVVTRPARVVGELVENSLDAGASRVEVAVRGDGTEEVRVVDDGHGMRRADAELAVDHHTTSKLSSGGDPRGVDSLGFRGEALAAIASTARLEIVTNDGGPRGARVVVDGDDRRVETAGRAPGTTVVVSDLFRDRPARRKALASPKAEFARVSEVVSRYALVRPDVRFRLVHDDRETLATPGSGDVVDALLGVYDRTVAGQSTAVDHETGLRVDHGAAAGGSDPPGREEPLRVDGRLCLPSVTRSTRDHVHVAVNGRAVADADVRRAVREGYGRLLPDGRFPVAVVRLTLPPAAVDANVHPAKEAVAFTDADAVTGTVRTAVRDALSTADLRREAEVATDLDSTLAPLDRESAFEDATVIGQYRGLYLLCEADDDLLVVDQHAAHERVNFERLRAALDGEAVPTSDLDPPATLSLTPTEGALVEAHADDLARLGFDVEAFGGGTYRVTAVPAPLGRTADPDAVREALAAVEAGTDGEDDPREAMLADLACHPSLKAGDALDPADAERLLARLGQCDQPYACPHGRPTVLTIDEKTLASGFGRRSTRFE
jgi:DNA mismatch repair protein MutL